MNANSFYKTYFLFFVCFFLLFSIKAVSAEKSYLLTIKNHVFIPSVITIPANEKVKLVIHNKDALAEEFDSFDLNREKVIFAGKKSTLFIGPLPTGEYYFFGEYHPISAQGKVVVKGDENAD